MKQNLVFLSVCLVFLVLRCQSSAQPKPSRVGSESEISEPNLSSFLQESLSKKSLEKIKEQYFRLYNKKLEDFKIISATEQVVAGKIIKIRFEADGQLYEGKVWGRPWLNAYQTEIKKIESKPEEQKEQKADNETVDSVNQNDEGPMLGSVYSKSYSQQMPGRRDFNLPISIRVELPNIGKNVNRCQKIVNGKYRNCRNKNLRTVSFNYGY